MAALLRFLRTHCANLALPRHGLSPVGILLQVEKERSMNQWQAGVCDTETNTPWFDKSLARLQRTESTEEPELQRSYFSPRGGQVWNWSEHHSEEVTEWYGWTDALRSRWNWSTWNETQTKHIEDYDEVPPIFP